VSLRDTIGALCGPGQARRVARYLAERGHVEGRGDLIRIHVARPGEGVGGSNEQ